MRLREAPTTQPEFPPSLEEVTVPGDPCFTHPSACALSADLLPLGESGVFRITGLPFLSDLVPVLSNNTNL